VPHVEELPIDFPVGAVAEAYMTHGAPIAAFKPSLERTGKVPTLFRGKGCRSCRQTGYRGRTGIHELMVSSDSIREMVVNRVNAGVIRQEAMKNGMLTLRQDGWKKVLSGITTIDEVARVTAGDIIA
jgi:general secretion pathway protein E/type IV pilus assembly protein PilB